MEGRVSDMVEAVSRALAKRWLERMTHRLAPDDERQKLENIWLSFADDARAAISAMHHATPEMLRALIGRATELTDASVSTEYLYSEAFAAAIDAALSPDQAEETR